MKADRKTELRAMLMARRQEVAGEVREKIQGVRAEGAEQHNWVVRNSLDVASAETQEDIELILIQMRVDTLSRIDQALGRLDHDAYGYCLDCGEEIAEKRLRALTFAVRCKDCEEAREAAEKLKQAKRREVAFGLFAQDDF